MRPAFVAPILLASLLAILLVHGAQARQPSRNPTFQDALNAAWARLPQRATLTARQNTAAARDLAGSALVPSAPTASGTYVNDRLAGSNYNYVTSQIGVSTPLWLPGEGTATRNLAGADSAVIDAAAVAAHHALAVQLLDLTAQATLAANSRDSAARRLRTNQALAADAARRFRVGESPESDALAAEAEAATSSIALATADAQVAAAGSALAVLTGIPAIPSLDISPLLAASTPHPRIAAAERAVQYAQANARLVRIANRDDPELGLEGINEKQPGTRWDTRFGVTLRFHFATEARNAPRRAAAKQVLTEAEVQLAQARREVTTATAQAEATLSGAERGIAAAARAAAVAEKRRGQIERAWRLGEMPLIELVRANAFAFDAALTNTRARTQRDAARLAFRLAQGTLP